MQRVKASLSRFFQVVEHNHQADAFNTFQQSRCHIDKKGFHNYFKQLGQRAL